MSRNIYERRQLRPYRSTWTLRDRVMTGFLIAIGIFLLASLGMWIFHSDYPMLFSVLAVLVFAGVVAIIRYGDKDWPAFLGIWMFLDRD